MLQHVLSRLCEFLAHAKHKKSIDQTFISWFSLSFDFMDNKVEFRSRQRRLCDQRRHAAGPLMAGNGRNSLLIV
jgi:hypothetical protein